MNLTRQTGIILMVLFIVIILAVTVLLAVGRDPEDLIDLITVTIIPAAIALWAGNRADKAAQSAERAVENTNGRMGQIIQGLIDQGAKIDVDEYDDVIKHNDITVPDDQVVIHGGAPDKITSINSRSAERNDGMVE